MILYKSDEIEFVKIIRCVHGNFFHDAFPQTQLLAVPIPRNVPNVVRVTNKYCPLLLDFILSVEEIYTNQLRVSAVRLDPVSYS